MDHPTSQLLLPKPARRTWGSNKNQPVRESLGHSATAHGARVLCRHSAGDIFGTLPKKLLAYPRSEAQLESGKCRAVDTRDVGEVAAKLLLIHASRRPAAAAHHGQRYDVSGPEGWSVRGLAALYEGALELPSGSIACLTLSEDEAAGLEQAGFPDWLARAVAVGQARYGAAGMNDYPSSEAVLALHPTFRTFQAWVDEHKALVKLESA